MPGDPKVFAIGLMALHDRAFFERLLDDPRAALRGNEMLASDPAVVEKVTRLISERGPISRAQAIEAWESFHQNGTMAHPWQDPWDD
jgi:hypothetical protein